MTDDELTAILAAMSAPPGFRQGGDYLAVQPVEGSEIYYGSHSPGHDSDVATGLWPEWRRLAEGILGVRRETVRQLVAEVRTLRAALAEKEEKETAAAESVEAQAERASLESQHFVFEQGAGQWFINGKIRWPIYLQLDITRRAAFNLLVSVASQLSRPEEERISLGFAGDMKPLEE
jgi:hypothetical protein